MGNRQMIIKAKAGILPALAAFLALALFSAPAFGGEFKAGIKGGVNFANVRGDDAGDSDSKMGFCGGAFIHLILGEILGIQPELLYTMKGYKSGDTKVILNYLEVPVLLKVSMPSPGSFRPHAFAGPAFAFKMNAKAKTDAGGQSTENDISDSVEDRDISLVFGAGVDISFLTVDARYTLGFKDVSTSGDVKNGVFSIMAGYMFFS